MSAMEREMARSRASRAFAAALLLFGPLANAALSGEQAFRVEVDIGTLPRLGSVLREENPYRTNAAAIAVGAQAFEQACSGCHVLATSGGIGPDLRMLNAACRKIVDESRRAICLRDQDYYFLKSVRDGKTIVGVTHMPAWRDFLSQEAIWAIRSYIESRAPSSDSGSR